MVEPMSPRLASMMTSRSDWAAASAKSSSTLNPTEPKRSKKATWGLMMPTVLTAASSVEKEKLRKPSAVSGKPHSSSKLWCGSMPTHNCPCLSKVLSSAAPKLVGNGGPSILGMFLKRFHTEWPCNDCFERANGRAQLGNRREYRLVGGRRCSTNFIAILASI